MSRTDRALQRTALGTLLAFACANAAGASAQPPGPPLVALRGGTFVMGTPPGTPGYRLETIPHRVTLAPFAIARAPVTNAEFAAFANGLVPELRARYLPEEPRDPRPGAPVTGVTWQGARAYARWLSARTGTAYALPSEAQWEYAARSTGAPGALWEWTGDCFDLRFYLHAPARDPRVIDEGCRTPVIRGGPMAGLPHGSVAMRADYEASGHPAIGFRVVRELDTRADVALIARAPAPPPPLGAPAHLPARGPRTLAITVAPPRTSLPIAVAAVFEVRGARHAVPLAFAGTTRIGGLPPGPLRVAFSTTVADGGLDRTVRIPERGTVSVRLGPAELVGPRVRRTLRGALRTRGGAPVGGATVVYDAYPQRVETRTRADGAFEIAGAQSGGAVLFVDVPGAARYTGVIPVPDPEPRGAASRTVFTVAPPAEDRS
jgi:Sulfatase-modifying factor enzyme 1